MIEFSCHTWAFDDLTLTEALGTIARLGFRYADLGSGAHLNPVKAAADARRVSADIIADLRVYNLKLADVYLLFPAISAKEESERRYEIDQFKAMLPLIKSLEAPGITLSSGHAYPDDNDAYGRVVDSLREMVNAAEELPISIEPHQDSMAQTPDDALALLLDVPGLKFTLDWGQFAQQNIKEEAIAKLLSHTRHVHIRQIADLNLAGVMRTLKAANYSGVVCVEYQRAPAVNVIRETVRVRDVLRDNRR